MKYRIYVKTPAGEELLCCIAIGKAHRDEWVKRYQDHGHDILVKEDR